MQERAGKGREPGKTCSLWVQVKPRSNRDRIVGFNEQGFLQVHVRARPEHGEANHGCCLQLSRALGISHSCVHLEKGHASRKKRIRIQGLTRGEVEEKIRKMSG